MPKPKYPERVVIEQLLEHNKDAEVHDICEEFFGYSRFKTSRVLFRVKNR